MDVNNMDTATSNSSANLKANVRELERKICGMSSHLTRVKSAVETMAAQLSLDDRHTPRRRTTSTDERYGRTDDELSRAPSPYRQRHDHYTQPRQQYPPRGCYVPRDQYSPREPPLNATPNTGFYDFVPDQPPRQARARNVRFDRTPEGAPVCAYFSKIGHLAKDCRSRKQHRMASNNTSRRPNQGGR